MTKTADHLYSISRDTRFVVRVTSEGHFKYVPTGISPEYSAFLPFYIELMLINSFVGTARTWCGELKMAKRGENTIVDCSFYCFFRSETVDLPF